MYVRPLYILGAAAAALGIYALVHKTIRFKGDLAQPGDKVLVPETAFQPGTLPAAIAGGVGYVVVTVQTVDNDFVNGYITSYILQENPLQETALPTPIGPVHLSRSLITSVYRGGLAVA